MLPALPIQYLGALFGLTASAFVFNTSEFMPIALLSDIAASFGMTEASVGSMVSIYAMVVAWLSLPLMLLTCNMELKKLMLITIGLFAVGQLVAGLATSYELLLAARICVACAHAIFWSITAPLATRLVPRIHQPFALSMIATGTSIAMVLGLPLGRVIGLYAGWRVTFLGIGIIAAGILAYLAYILPRRYQTQAFTLRDLPAVFKNKTVLCIYAITVFYATAYYTTYSYIEPYLKLVAGLEDGLITTVLMILGASGLLGGVIFSRGYGRHRIALVLGGLIGVTVALALWRVAAISETTIIAICVALGIVSMVYGITFQAELLKAVARNSATVSMSIYSGIFNLGIGSGTYIGSTLTAEGYLGSIGYVGAGLAFTALGICFFLYIPRIKQEKYTPYRTA